MSRIDNWDENERQLFAIGSRAIIDNLERQAVAWRESWPLDTTSTDAMVREHNAKMRQLEEDHKTWLAQHLADLYGTDDNGQGDGTNGLGQQQAPHDASGRGPATPAGVPAAGRLDHVAGLTADDIAALSMADYMRLRADLGVESPASANRSFFSH